MRVRRRYSILRCWVLLAATVSGAAQNFASPVLARRSLHLSFVQEKASKDKPDAGSEASLEKVLSQMDSVAANFRTTEATFVWDQYQKVVNDTDQQKGKVYFRRAGKETQMMAEIADPDHKYVLYLSLIHI